MEERGDELDLGRSGGEVLLEDHVALVETALPRSLLPHISSGSILKLTRFGR